MTVKHTFVLPVHNAQQSLSNSVENLLEELGECHDDFELMIIDDGSTDDTLDVACDLSTQFPQVRLIHRPVQYGFDASVQTALRNAKGQEVSIAITDNQPGKIRFRRIETAGTGHSPHFVTRANPS